MSQTDPTRYTSVDNRIRRLERLREAMAGLGAGSSSGELSDAQLREIRDGLKRLERGTK